MSPESQYAVIKAMVLAGGISIIITIFRAISKGISHGIDKLKK